MEDTCTPLRARLDRPARSVRPGGGVVLPFSEHDGLAAPTSRPRHGGLYLRFFRYLRPRDPGCVLGRILSVLLAITLVGAFLIALPVIGLLLIAEMISRAGHRYFRRSR
jgi:hypothetical protein